MVARWMARPPLDPTAQRLVEYPELLAGKLWRFARERNMDAEELAAFLGTSPSVVNHLAEWDVPRDPRVVEHLVQILGLDQERLLTVLAYEVMRPSP